MAETVGAAEKVTIFHQEAGITYRIPALLYLPSESTFLAFAEKRASPRDEEAKVLVMRRGRKEGLSVKPGVPKLGNLKTCGLQLPEFSSQQGNCTKRGSNWENYDLC